MVETESTGGWLDFSRNRPLTSFEVPGRAEDGAEVEHAQLALPGRAFRVEGAGSVVVVENEFEVLPEDEPRHFIAPLRAVPLEGVAGCGPGG